MTKLSTLSVKVWTVGATIAVGVAAGSGAASADSTDDYPIPRRMLNTACTVDQYMGAARDVSPVYFERYMIDYNNRPIDIQTAARVRIYWFFSLDSAGRRQYSERNAADVYYERMATHWGNWAKLFFNNKGVVAHATDVCINYPPVDANIWNWGSNRSAPTP
ncbi:DUF5078 domain-containing protein [Mycolicibacterium frederiksbergense]|uniref:DUF5078 domain-containing protein n=1 Tax=Mycolicibacterium frederiksbergense TaxID=117567 RepID=UPI00399B66EC